MAGSEDPPGHRGLPPRRGRAFIYILLAVGIAIWLATGD